MPLFRLVVSGGFTRCCSLFQDKLNWVTVRRENRLCTVSLGSRGNAGSSNGAVVVLVVMVVVVLVILVVVLLSNHQLDFR